MHFVGWENWGPVRRAYVPLAFTRFPPSRACPAHGWDIVGTMGGGIAGTALWRIDAPLRPARARKHDDAGIRASSLARTLLGRRDPGHRSPDRLPYVPVRSGA